MDEKILLFQKIKPNDENIKYNSFFFRRDIIDKYIKMFNYYCDNLNIDSHLKNYKIYNIDDIIFYLLNKPGVKTRRYNLLNNSENWQNIKKYIISLISISLSEVCKNNVSDEYVIKSINKYISPILNNNFKNNYDCDLIIIAPQQIEDNLLYIHDSNKYLYDDENDDDNISNLDFKLDETNEISEHDKPISLKEMQQKIYNELDKFEELKFFNYKEQFKEKFKLIVGFALVNRGKCKIFPNDYALNLICSNVKGIGSVIIGLYLYTILKHPITSTFFDIFDDEKFDLNEKLNGNAEIIYKKVKRSKILSKYKYEKKYGIDLYKKKFKTNEPLIPTNGNALLDLANSYKNIAGLCSYEKFGFVYDKNMFSDDPYTKCTNEVGILPMNIYFGDDTNNPCYNGLSIEEKIDKILNIAVGNNSIICRRNYICNSNLNNINLKPIRLLLQQLYNLKLYQEYFMSIYNTNSLNILKDDEFNELDDDDIELFDFLKKIPNNYGSDYNFIIKLIESIENNNVIPELEYIYKNYLKDYEFNGGKKIKNKKSNKNQTKIKQKKIKNQTKKNKKSNKKKIKK